jgi:hypothetical protein
LFRVNDERKGEFTTAPRLVRLAWREPFEVYTQVVWNTRRSISSAQAAFMDTAREVLSS